MSQTKHRTVSFKATKREPRKVKISFRSSGKRITFTAVKRKPKVIKLNFGEKKRE